MAGGTNSSQVECRTCGRASPTTLLQCPACGTSLALPPLPSIASDDRTASSPELTTIDVASQPGALHSDKRSLSDEYTIATLSAPNLAEPDEHTSASLNARESDEHTVASLSAPSTAEPDAQTSASLPSEPSPDEHTDVSAIEPPGAPPPLTDALPDPTHTLDGATSLHPSPRRRPVLPRLTPAFPTSTSNSNNADPANGSSDPHTSFMPRYGDHIELPPGSVVLDAYEIDVKLGAGAMGEVYAARHLKLGKRVAIKVISPRLSQVPTSVDRFSREARVLARVHHPGIVAVEDVGELPDGRALFVMEYLTGEPLDVRLRRGPIPFDEAIDILDQMARALEAAHRHGVIHRDLKPANIFLVRLPDEPRPVVKLLDFGLAKLAVDSEGGERTKAGVALGTPMYLSPEQAHGPNVDPRTDIYALGCLAYELLLGRVPFRGSTALGLMSAHLHETPPRPSSLWPSIPVALDRILFDMLAKSPDSRPTLAQLRAVFANLMAPAAPAHAQRAETYVAAPALPSRVILAVLIALAMLCGAAIAIAATRR